MDNNQQRDHTDEAAVTADIEREGLEELAAAGEAVKLFELPDPDTDDPADVDDPNQGPLQYLPEAQLMAWARDAGRLQDAGGAGIRYAGVEVMIGVRNGHLCIDIDPNGALDHLPVDQGDAAGVLPVVVQLNGDKVFDHQYPNEPAKALKLAHRTDEMSFRRRAPKMFGGQRIEQIVHFLPGTAATYAAAIVICANEDGTWSTDLLVEADDREPTHRYRWYLRDHETAWGLEGARQDADSRVRKLR